MPAKTFGYARQMLVPKIEGTTPKVCRTCQGWFASRPREQRCDACLPASERRRRTARASYAQIGSESRSGGFQPTHPRTPKRRVSSSNGQVTSTVSDRGEMCRAMAFELAEKIDFPHGRPRPMSRAFKRAVTLRNVNSGKQGRCDLEQYS